MKNIKWLLIKVCEWSIVQQNINAGFKEDNYFVDEVETLIKEKNYSRAANLRKSTNKRKSYLQSSHTHTP
jgi:hypothetical protein